MELVYHEIHRVEPHAGLLYIFQQAGGVHIYQDIGVVYNNLPHAMFICPSTVSMDSFSRFAALDTLMSSSESAL